MKKTFDKVRGKERAPPLKGNSKQQATHHGDEDIKDYQMLDVNHETGEITETNIDLDKGAESFLVELDLYKNLPSIYGSTGSNTVTTENGLIFKLGEASSYKVDEGSRIHRNTVLKISNVEKVEESASTELDLYEQAMVSLLKMSAHLDQREAAVRKREEELGLAMSQPLSGGPSNFSTTRPAEAGPEYTREEFMEEIRHLRDTNIANSRKTTPSPHTDPGFQLSRSVSETSSFLQEHGDLVRHASAFWVREGTTCNSEASSLKGKDQDKGSSSSNEEEGGEFFEVAVLRSTEAEFLMPALEDVVASAPVVLQGHILDREGVSEGNVEEGDEKAAEKEEGKETKKEGRLERDQHCQAGLFEVRRIRDTVRVAAAGSATAVVIVLAWAVQMTLRGDRERDRQRG